MNKVAIVGVGLIGASFALALRKAGFGGEIVGVSSPAALEAGIQIGAISGAASLEEAAHTCDLIYLAQPVDRILETLEKLGPQTPSHTLITDAGSTKSAIVHKAQNCLRHANFIGGHPLAGKEQSGAEFADADLFRDRPYVLTPTQQDTGALAEFREWLARIGARMLEVSAEEHDRVVALTSHLPQLISIALAYTLAGQKNDNIRKIFGPGLIDMTRLALSSPELWDSILATNRGAVLAALDAFEAAMAQLRAALEVQEYTSCWAEARRFAGQLRNPAVITLQESVKIPST